jgi:hypothetical protein
MKKIVPVELIADIANALVSMTGLSYIEVQRLIDRLNQTKVYEEPEKNEEKKDLRQTK